MSRQTLARRARALRALHQKEVPLLLPNAWDAASARIVQELGFAAVATSSGAIAQSLGHSDGEAMPSNVAFDAIRRIAEAVAVPVTADLESGYGLDASHLVELLLEVGAVGCNLEDTNFHTGGGLVDAEAQAERLAAVRSAASAAGVDIVLNARVDVFRGRNEVTEELMSEAIWRARLYLAAGADCVFPILLDEDHAIAKFVAVLRAPVNVLLRPTAPSIVRLAELGVRRISLGSRLFQTACRAVEQELAAIQSELR